MPLKFFLIFFVEVVYGYGIGFHLTQVGRFNKNCDSYLKSGALFPESMERCGIDNINWDQFVGDGVELWHQNYNDEIGDHGLKQFLLGISMGHVITSLQTETSHSLVEVLANLEFKNDINDTIQFLSGPADLIHLSQVLRNPNDEWDYYSKTEINLPLQKDIEDLLSFQHIESKWSSIVTCMLQMASVLQSELYLLTNKRLQSLEIAYMLSPRAAELMKSHWQGGEWNVVAVLQSCVPKFESFFSKKGMPKESKSLLNMCKTGIMAKELHDDGGNLESQAEKYISPIVPLAVFGSSLALGKFLEGETCIAVGSPLEQRFGSIYLMPISQIGEVSERNRLTPLYGSKVHAFSLLGNDYLVVSEPGSHAVHFYLYNEKILTIYDYSATFQEVNLVTNIDSDHFPDLVLASPQFSYEEVGRVRIVPGLNIAPYLISGQKNQVQDIEAIGSIDLNGPQSLSYQHYGVATASSAGFIFIACQSIGVVYVYNLQHLNSGNLPTFYVVEDNIILPNDDMPWQLEKVGSYIHGLFGSLLYQWEYMGIDYIAISQPLFNRVYIYRDCKDSLIEFWLVLELDHVLDFETVQFSIEFGKGITFNPLTGKLYVSSPGS